MCSQAHTDSSETIIKETQFDSCPVGAIGGNEDIWVLVERQNKIMVPHIAVHEALPTMAEPHTSRPVLWVD